MTEYHYCVYIMTDEQHTKLYTGRTGNLKRRVAQHRSGNGGVYTRRYSLVKLVYYEAVEDESAARTREKQLKRCSKKQRVKLIENINPAWNDLYAELKMKDQHKGPHKDRAARSVPGSKGTNDHEGH